MHKSLLLDFISKYNVSKAESVLWTISDNTLKTKFNTSNNSLIAEISLKNFNVDGFDGAELGIYSSAQLIKLLTSLEDDINISLLKVGDNPISIQFNDIIKEANYALADKAIIPSAKSLKHMPTEFEVIIPITSDFCDAFIKAKTALPDVEMFSIESNGTKTKIILGQTDINTNTITINPTTTKSDKLERMYFNANMFANILSVNKNIETNLLITTEAPGAATVTFDTNDYKAFYLLVAKRK